MELAMNLLLMLGGVAVFMFGMKTMGQGLAGVGAGVRKLFKKINKNRVVDYGVGVIATVAVQSSSATSILTVGLANAGIVTVKQGSGIILGAKVGTTLTAFIFALGLLSKGSFSISAVFAAIAFVGVIIIFTTNNESWKKAAYFMVGFGMLFVGLEVMEFAIGGADSILSIQLATLFQFEFMLNPILLVLLGIVFTCIIQSSTAASGIFLMFLSTGVIHTLDQSFFLIMGANVGTCLDGILASLGTNENGKRIALFHVLTSTIGAIVFTVILVIFRAPITGLFEYIFPTSQEWAWGLATFNLSYNLIYTLILLILLNPIVASVTKIVKKKKPKESELYFINERFLATPSVAIEQSLKEVSNMAVMAEENFSRAFSGLIEGDMSQSKKIAEQEYQIDNITRALANYFIQISSTSISAKEKQLIGGLHHVINDIERIGDYAVLVAKETNYMLQLEAKFLDQTKEELNEINTKISNLFSLSFDVFQTRKTKNLKHIAEVHNEINDLITSIKDIHVKRLSSNMYPVEVSKSLYTVLISLQRVADHTVNIAFSIRSNTGSKSETFEIMGKKRPGSRRQK